jgi:hypothetical protein
MIGRYVSWCSASSHSTASWFSLVTALPEESRASRAPPTSAHRSTCRNLQSLTGGFCCNSLTKQVLHKVSRHQQRRPLEKHSCRQCCTASCPTGATEIDIIAMLPNGGTLLLRCHLCC